MIDTGLNGKTVIVTGANHGIGAAIAITLAREGAKVLSSFLRQSLEQYGETVISQKIWEKSSGQN